MKEIKEKYDVIVIGGGLAGVCSAISATMHGSKVAIIQDRPVFGGNSSSEIRVPVGGANFYNDWARETGIIEELLVEERVRNHDVFQVGRRNSNWDMVLYEKIKEQPNLTMYLNASAINVEMSDKKHIRSVTCFQVGNERKLNLSADFFIDCTGDATVGALAGADFRIGREASAEFNESLAPDKSDNKTQGSSVFFRARNAGHPVPFNPPSWAKKYHTDESLNRGHHSVNKMAKDYVGFWWLEIGTPFDIIDQNEEIKDKIYEHFYGIWDHLKNYGNHGVENMYIDWIGSVPGKRESRRLMGEYVLTQNDVCENTPFPDRVAYGGWYIDIHKMGGLEATGKENEGKNWGVPLFRSNAANDEVHVRTYSIPLRSLYSRNIDNLFMAGRDISVTHVALGTTRLMLTCSLMGQAVGAAASLCLKYKINPSQLVKIKIKELQQTLLKDDCFILDCPNMDPCDLALHNPVVGSSQAPLSLAPKKGSNSLEYDIAQIFPISEDWVESVSLYLESSLKKDIELSLEFLPATDIWSFNDLPKPIKKGKIKVPKGYSGWITFPIGAKVKGGSLYRINIYASPGINWRLSKPVPGVSIADKNPAWKRWDGRKHLPCAMKVNPRSFPFFADNITNGVARPEKWANIWISDPRKPLPQSVILPFKKPQKFDTLYISFDTFLIKDFRNLPPGYRFPECVSDYRVLIKSGNQWKEIIRVEGNYQRRRVHRLPSVTSQKLMLEITKTNGDKSVRVYEIRIYNEENEV